MTNHPNRNWRARMRASSYRAAARRLHHYADIIERYADASEPRERQQLTRAIYGVAAYAARVSRRHHTAPSALTQENEMSNTKQIERLEQDAALAGDLKQVAICRRALDGNAEAIAECQRVIDAAVAADIDDDEVPELTEEQILGAQRRDRR